MQDLPARTRVIALSRAADGGRLEHPPRRGTRFAPGDEAYLLGSYEELLRVPPSRVGTRGTRFHAMEPSSDARAIGGVGSADGWV